MKDVHDNVDEIQEHPPALRHALYVKNRTTRGLHILDDSLRNAANVGVRRAGRDDEIVGHVGHPVQIEHHDVVCIDVETRRNSLACERLVFMCERGVRETFGLQV